MTCVIETDDAGRLVLSPELLGKIKPHSRYTVESAGAVLILQPENKVDAETNKALTPEEWKEGWDALVKQIASVTPPGSKTALEELTDMRNARG